MRIPILPARNGEEEWKLRYTDIGSQSSIVTYAIQKPELTLLNTEVNLLHFLFGQFDLVHLESKISFHIGYGI